MEPAATFCRLQPAQSLLQALPHVSQRRPLNGEFHHSPLQAPSSCLHAGDFCGSRAIRPNSQAGKLLQQTEHSILQTTSPRQAVGLLKPPRANLQRRPLNAKHRSIVVHRSCIPHPVLIVTTRRTLLGSQQAWCGLHAQMIEIKRFIQQLPYFNGACIFAVYLYVVDSLPIYTIFYTEYTVIQ